MATPGSEAKSVSLVPERGGGRGMSVAPQLAPLSLEKYPRCGRRKISLEAPTRILGWLGLRLMKVSLCGPHSLEAFTHQVHARKCQSYQANTTAGEPGYCGESHRSLLITSRRADDRTTTAVRPEV